MPVWTTHEVQTVLNTAREDSRSLGSARRRVAAQELRGLSSAPRHRALLPRTDVHELLTRIALASRAPTVTLRGAAPHKLG